MGGGGGGGGGGGVKGDRVDMILQILQQQTYVK